MGLIILSYEERVAKYAHTYVRRYTRKKQNKKEGREQKKKGVGKEKE